MYRPMSLQNLFSFFLHFAALSSCASAQSDGVGERSADELEALAKQLREALTRAANIGSTYSGQKQQQRAAEGLPPVLDLHLQLAVTLQQLNHLKPDGGRRVQEAESSYRQGIRLGMRSCMVCVWYLYRVCKLSMGSLCSGDWQMSYCLCQHVHGFNACRWPGKRWACYGACMHACTASANAATVHACCLPATPILRCLPLPPKGTAV